MVVTFKRTVAHLPGRNSGTFNTTFAVYITYKQTYFPLHTVETDDNYTKCKKACFLQFMDQIRYIHKSFFGYSTSDFLTSPAKSASLPIVRLISNGIIVPVAFERSKAGHSFFDVLFGFTQRDIVEFAYFPGVVSVGTTSSQTRSRRQSIKKVH